MSNIKVEVRISEVDSYSNRVLVALDAAAVADNIPAFTGHVSEHYAILAHKAVWELVREVEADENLNKALRGKPCCVEFEAAMNKGEYNNAPFCEYCGRRIGDELKAKAIKLAPKPYN
jgi:hypothetical protein